MFEFQHYALTVGEVLIQVDPESLAVPDSMEGLADLTAVLSACYNLDVPAEDAALLMLACCATIH